jgi:hypothetical protein
MERRFVLHMPLMWIERHTPGSWPGIWAVTILLILSWTRRTPATLATGVADTCGASAVVSVLPAVFAQMDFSVTVSKLQTSCRRENLRLRDDYTWTLQSIHELSHRFGSSPNLDV